MTENHRGNSPPGRALYRITKRGLDILAAGGGLCVLALPLGAVAAAIKLDSPGPVFYRGRRVGRGGRVFRIFKFRSMYVGDGAGASSTREDDPRITRVGAVIRRYKLDELAQLINVVVGDMSLVGPRPQVKEFVDTYYTDEEREVFKVRPGITDWASIRFHNEGEILAASDIADPDEAYRMLIHPEKMRLQLEYVRSPSLRTDLEILWRTLAKLFFHSHPDGRELAGAGEERSSR
jgi:lipopolysaccharide/colanic/teichoic acid biosynthesis glycosyltransferase